MKIIKFRYVALTIGLLLASIVTLPAEPAAQAAATQTIVLQHIIPSNIINSQHWNQPTNLPTGVTQVKADPAHNVLVVTATPAGFARVQEIVKLLDFMPRQIKITSAFAFASTAEVQASSIQSSLMPVDKPKPNQIPDPNLLRYMTGTLAAQFLQVLTDQNKLVEDPIIITTDKATATLTLSLPPNPAQYPAFEPQTYSVYPQINSDNSITMVLASTFFEGPVKREICTTRTIPNGQTLVLVFPSALPHSKGKNILLFVKPIIQ